MGIYNSNSDTVDGFHASSTATASTILPLNGSSKYPISALPSGTHVRLGINKVNTTATVVAATYTTYATVTATSSGGECEADFRIVIGNGNSGADRSILYKVQCDGVDITPAGMVAGFRNSSFALNEGTIAFLVSSTPAAGSHTWTLQISASAATSIVMDQAVLKITEIAA